MIYLGTMEIYIKYIKYLMTLMNRCHFMLIGGLIENQVDGFDKLLLIS
jgi:hypothetical protein